MYWWRKKSFFYSSGYYFFPPSALTKFPYYNAGSRLWLLELILPKLHALISFFFLMMVVVYVIIFRKRLRWVSSTCSIPVSILLCGSFALLPPTFSILQSSCKIFHTVSFSMFTVSLSFRHRVCGLLNQSDWNFLQFLNQDQVFTFRKWIMNITSLHLAKSNTRKELPTVLTALQHCAEINTKRICTHTDSKTSLWFITAYKWFTSAGNILVVFLLSPL